MESVYCLLERGWGLATMDTRFLAFITVSALLIVVPGPDMALVARNALRTGQAGAWSTALGVSAGIMAWGLAAVCGLAALLAESAAVFTIVKLLGAAYLLYLGVQSLRAGPASRPTTSDAAGGAGAWTVCFRQGVLGNLLNPKAAVIFVTVIPQFIKPEDPAARLVFMLLVFELMILGWLTLYGLAVSRASQSRIGRHFQDGMRRVTGLVLIGLALRLAAERR